MDVLRHNIVYAIFFLSLLLLLLLFLLELQLLLFHIDFCTAWPARLDVGPLLY